jgi:hypothetical protein
MKSRIQEITMEPTGDVEFYKRLCLFLVYAWHMEDEHPKAAGRGPSDFSYRKAFRDDYSNDEASPFSRPYLVDWLERAAKALRKIPEQEIITPKEWWTSIPPLNEAIKQVEEESGLKLRPPSPHPNPNLKVKEAKKLGNNT